MASLASLCASKALNHVVAERNMKIKADNQNGVNDSMQHITSKVENEIENTLFPGARKNSATTLKQVIQSSPAQPNAQPNASSFLLVSVLKHIKHSA